MSLTGHELVEHLFPYHPPRTETVGETLDMVRAEFTDLADMVVDLTPVSADQTYAIRKLHDALQSVIGVIVNNQQG
jgi:hypothetical protein